MQDWSSRIWILKNKEQVQVQNMSLDQVLDALWAIYILTLKNPKFLGVPYSNLGNALYSRMRTLRAESEFERTRKIIT